MNFLKRAMTAFLTLNLASPAAWAANSDYECKEKSLNNVLQSIKTKFIQLESERENIEKEAQAALLACTVEECGKYKGDLITAAGLAVVGGLIIHGATKKIKGLTSEIATEEATLRTAEEVEHSFRASEHNRKVKDRISSLTEDIGNRRSSRRSYGYGSLAITLVYLAIAGIEYYSVSNAASSSVNVTLVSDSGAEKSIPVNLSGVPAKVADLIRSHSRMDLPGLADEYMSRITDNEIVRTNDSDDAKKLFEGQMSSTDKGSQKAFDAAISYARRRAEAIQRDGAELAEMASEARSLCAIFQPPSESIGAALSAPAYQSSPAKN